MVAVDTHPVTRKEQAILAKLLAPIGSESEMRFRQQTKWISLVLAAIFGLIGAGFAFGSSRASASPDVYRLIILIEGGDIRVHGLVMMVLSAAVFYTAREWRPSSRYALEAMGFYALMCTLLILGNWWLGTSKIAWPSPWWYLLVATLCLVLVRIGPRGASRRLHGAPGGGGRV